jgi:aspartyl-tRNA(Asn)/glutamyl-tRNA(Gln) amidotransferase subunit A
MELAKLTLSQTLGKLRAGEMSSRELVQSVIDAIAAKDGDIGGYLSYDAETALAAADRADTSLPLGGIPIAIKDIINVKGELCSCASKILHGKYTSPYDATVIRKLREAGAIPLGRANMDEFAMGSSTENSGLQITRNPHDLDRIPGGSSGGSAAVVAAHEAIAALGTDTGGSIRQPASLCGCVGVKPTYGRVSRFGAVAYASSLDQIGPITKTTEDAARILSVIAGLDPNDSTTLNAEVPDYVAGLEGGIKGLRVGLPKEYFIDGIEPGVRASVDAAIKKLVELGAEPVEISLPNSEFAVATYYIIATAEASANLARFDGIRYGHRAANPENLIDQYRKSRAEGFGDEVKRRILLGTYVLSSGYYDAYYLRAQKVRTLIRQDFTSAFEKVDVIASPTSPVPAFKIGERSGDPLHMYLADIFTIAANLAGICGISVPCGAVASDTGTQLPVGLQLLGKPLDESTILRAAHSYEMTIK